MTCSLDPDTVTDRASFERFVDDLAADRRGAEDLERADPHRFRLGGARDWQNCSISMFLDGALAGTQDRADWASEGSLTWRDLAVFLYLGKIYE